MLRFRSLIIIVTFASILSITRSSSTEDNNKPDLNSTDLFQFSASAPALQLKKDAHAVIDAFASIIQARNSSSFSFNSTTQSAEETARLFQEVVKGALSYHLDQGIGTNSTSPSTDRLQSMSNSINETLESVNEVTDRLLSSTDGALRFMDLKNCLTQLVQQGGLHDGESCVVNGMSVTGVSDIMDSVLKNYGGGIIPKNILSLTTKALNPSFKTVIPGEAAFYDSIDQAIRSVQSSVSGELVQALNDAQQCFMETAYSSITYAERLKKTEECNRDIDKSSSVYRDLKTLYLSITNQFVGYVIPNLLESIHEISASYLAAKISKFPQDLFFRQAITATIRSIVASNSGNQVTYAYKIADCLDTIIAIPDPASAARTASAALCLQKPDGPPASAREIIYGYTQQVYGFLPSTIAAQIESSELQHLNKSDPNYFKKVKALHQSFLKSNPGPDYVSCYERFMDCLFEPRVGGALVFHQDTQITCILGDACRKTPDGQKIPVLRPN
ncbi:uncharacterized protein MELLADRAFT_124335 [Melampsora larici-populina 98AG31]|uniref:Secreted protein n=1 Tax=Melampsora larici-populina (strain 98AG31 / pathotype 3-4-7) TaxID=747676 RepID=F4RZN0_MELLP|nr:uncharacterized protein MELLADRAFT_124335 [Melampsora larici-populina 98AG31]EGG02032.1 secreted protein [Melampsora larici-populina 98AG31]